MYTGYYVALEPVAGATWAVVVGIPLWLSATAFQAASAPHAWACALGVHVLSWYAQIHPGHLILERRRPAIMDSVFQSLVLAPLFVWIEVLFACGYRPELCAEVGRRIDLRVRVMDAGKNK